ncbi:hypothetical protein D3C71_78510 [compost metagenome]
MLVQMLAFVGWIAIGGVGLSSLVRKTPDDMVAKIFTSNVVFGILLMMASILFWPAMVPFLALLERYGRKLAWWS